MPGAVAAPIVPARTQASLETCPPDLFSPTDGSFAGKRPELPGAYIDHQIQDTNGHAQDANAAAAEALENARDVALRARKAQLAASMNKPLPESDSGLLLDSPPNGTGAGAGATQAANGVVTSAMCSPVSTSFASHTKHGSSRVIPDTAAASDADDSADDYVDEIADERPRRAAGSPIKALYQLSSLPEVASAAEEQDKCAQLHHQQLQVTRSPQGSIPQQRSRLLEDPQAAYAFTRARSPSAQEAYHQALQAEQFADSSLHSQQQQHSTLAALANEGRLRQEGDGGRRTRNIHAKFDGLVELGTVIPSRSSRVPPPTLATDYAKHGRLNAASSSDSIGTAELAQQERQQETSQAAALQAFYKDSGANTDLADWAPLAQPPINVTDVVRSMSGTGELLGTRHRLASNPSIGPASPGFESIHSGRTRIKNLPDWASLRDDDLTSYPIGDVRRDVDLAVKELLNEGVFEQVLKDARARIRFRTHLAQRDGVEDKLDLVFDLE